MDPIKGTFLLVLGIIIVVIVVLICVYYIVKASANSKIISGEAWQGSPSFRDGIKSNGLDAEKVISYGKTYFIYDEAGRNIFIQTAKSLERMTINSSEVASFEVFRDGKAIEPEDVNPEPDFSGIRHTSRSCYDLHITISRKDGSEIILPVINSPTQYEYIYTRAMEVANEIAAVLKGIINNNI